MRVSHSIHSYAHSFKNPHSKRREKSAAAKKVHNEYAVDSASSYLGDADLVHLLDVLGPREATRPDDVPQVAVVNGPTAKAGPVIAIRKGLFKFNF